MDSVYQIKSFFFSNVSTRQTIFKNTLWLSAGSVVNKLLSLALIIYAARILGAEGYGQFTFALAFVSLLVVFSHLGLPAIITREFAREQENRHEFYSLVSLKLLLSVATFFLIVGLSFIFVQASQVQNLIMIVALFLLTNSLIGTAYSYFHSQQKMEYEAWLEILQMALLVSLGLFVLFQFPSAQNLSYAYAGSASVALVATFVLFGKKIFPVRLRWDIAVWKKYLRMSWPLAFIGLFGMVYSYTDSVMLGYWNLFEETGWYNAAQRIVMAGLIPMGFIGAAFYPVLSKFAKESAERLQRAWNYEMEIMIGLAIPLVVGGIVLAPYIISTLYSIEFAPSVLAFQMLIVTAGLTFLYRPLYDTMIALNHERKTFWITITGAAANVMLNAVLIPQYSLYGAAAATVVTYSLVLAIISVFLRRFTFVRFPMGRIGLIAVLSVVATAFMYIAIQGLLMYNLHVVLVIAGAGAIYGGVFLLGRKYVLQTFFKQMYA